MSSKTEPAALWSPAIGVTLGVALALRVIGLDGPLWYDEILTLVHSVRQPLRTLLTEFPDVSQHPLYCLLAHVSIGWFGETNWALRLPAALAGVGMLAALWVIGRRLLPASEAWAAVAVLATSYHHVWFSQNARGYTLLGALVLISTDLLLRALDDPRPRTLATYAVVTALGVYTHLTMALVTAGQVGILMLVMVLRPATAASWRVPRLAAAVACAAALSVLAYLPFAESIVRAVAGPPPPSSAAVATGGWAIAEAVRGLVTGAGGLTTLVAAGLALAGGLSLLTRRPVALLLLTVPAVTTVGPMLVMGQPVRPRFLFFMAGAAALCLARGLGVVAAWACRRRPGWSERVDQATVLATLVLVALSLTALPRNYRTPKQDFDGAVAWVDARVRDGATAVAVPPACLPVSEYYRRNWPCIEHDADLARLAANGDLLVFSTLREYADDVALLQRLETACVPVATFPGTLGGGDIVICRLGPQAGARP